MSKQTERQLSLFDTALGIAKELGVKQKKVTVRPHKRTGIRKPERDLLLLCKYPERIDRKRVAKGG